MRVSMFKIVLESLESLGKKLIIQGFFQVLNLENFVDSVFVNSILCDEAIDHD